MVFEIVEVAGTMVTIFTNPGEPALSQQPLWFHIGLALALLAAIGRRRSRAAGPLRRSAA